MSQRALPTQAIFQAAEFLEPRLLLSGAAVDDYATVDENQSVTIDFLANDDSTFPFTFIDLGMPNSGDVFDNGGTLEYTPYPGATGSDSFEYTLIDEMTGASASAMVYITINDDPTNYPVAVDDYATVDENASVNIDFLTNDTGFFDFIDFGTPSNGEVIDLGGTFQYTAYPGTGGSTDSFEYTLIDEMTGFASSAMVYITITSGSQTNGPVAVDDYASVDENGSVTIDFLANDTGSYTTVDVGVPTSGDLIDNGGTYEYTPYPGTGGTTDSFQYTIIDDTTGAGSTATVTIDIVSNSANGPIAVDDTVTINENQTVTILVLQNDSDPFGGYLSLLNVTTASMGDVTLDPTLNTLVYTPWPNQTGSDSFEYTLINDLGLTATATVFVTVTLEETVSYLSPTLELLPYEDEAIAQQLPQNTVIEGTTARIKISIIEAIEEDVSFTIATSNGTANSPLDYETFNQMVTIPAGETEAIFEIKTLLNYDEFGQAVDINEAIETFQVEIMNDGVAESGLQISIDDDYAMTTLGTGPFLLKRTSSGTGGGNQETTVGFEGGSNERGSGDDQILSYQNPSAINLPFQGKLYYFDDWTPIVGTWLMLSAWNPFANGKYDAGTRKGNIMTHNGESYYFSALLGAAKDDKIGSAGDFEDFLKEQKRFYKIDQKMRALRTHLLQFNNKYSRELLKLQDEHWFKIGIANAISESNFENIKKYVEAVEGVAGSIDKFASLIPEEIINNTTIVLREAKLVQEIVSGTITTVSSYAIEFTSIQKVLVVWNDGSQTKGFLYEKTTFESLEVINVETVSWQLTSQISIPGIEVEASTLMNALDNANKVLGSSVGLMMALEGAFSNNLIDKLHWIEGILKIGETWSPRGISDILEYIRTATTTAMFMMEGIDDALMIQNIDHWLQSTGMNFRESNINEFASETTGASTTHFLGSTWLKNNSPVFKKVID